MASTILVVDDEPDVELLITQRFRAAIRSKEFYFLFARDGEEALQVLKDHPEVDIVLSDINMPRMDGLTLLKHLQVQCSRPHGKPDLIRQRKTEG